jgi:hypothetical protein
MTDPASQAQLKEAIADCIGTDQGVLDALREEIRPLKIATRCIQPRATTSISLVGTDGGNSQLQFDPFLIHLVRVVDSSNNEYCLEAVSKNWASCHPSKPVRLMPCKRRPELQNRVQIIRAGTGGIQSDLVERVQQRLSGLRGAFWRIPCGGGDALQAKQTALNAGHRLPPVR